MFMSKNQFVLLVLVLSCLSTFTSLPLHRDEVVTLSKIMKTFGADQGFEFKQDCTSESLVTKVGQLKELEVTNVRCSCSSNFSGTCHIVEFTLKSFSLPGSLPPEMADLKYLEHIELTRNYLHGTFPVEWASLKNLKFISVTANRLSGSIPSYLGRFPSLTYLSLEANQFSGTIPRELGNVLSLTDLVLSNNQLEGNLPETLTQLKNLTNFRVSDNKLSGRVPNFIQNMTQLERLDLYASGLEGPIPPEIFHFENLTDLRISDMPGPEFQFPNMSKKIKSLILRNMNLIGKIPEDIWKLKDLKLLDVTFNMLEGSLSFDLKFPNFTFLSGNRLSGYIPEKFLSQDQIIDLSYNNFSWPSNCQERININTYRSSSFKKNLSGLLPCSNISVCKKYYRSFYVNCGGPDVAIKNVLYEGDQGVEGGAARNYIKGTNWGFSSTGDYLDDSQDVYTLSANSSLSMEYPQLYSTARRTPLSLTYYGYCLKNGDYTVKLHFAEIQLTNEDVYNKLAKRVFDIYVQGKLLWKDFNIVKEAKGSKRSITKVCNTKVVDNTLEIRLYWAGKGTTVIPHRGNYGPLISAMSVSFSV